MILFAVSKKKEINPQTQKEEYIIDESDYFKIPTIHDKKEHGEINENSIQLISWNQAISPVTQKPIDSVYDLFATVCCIPAINPNFHDIYTRMSDNFKELYNTKIEIINEFFNYIKQYSINPESKIPIFQTIYENWPHPMIGNIRQCNRVRPQIYHLQYMFNWRSIPQKYMSENTQKCIDTLLKRIYEQSTDIPSPQGLRKLKKSGRDQCRICKDWTELASAVFGEISSYISKLLEKKYALDLCNSTTLLKEQIRLLDKIVAYGEYKSKDNPRVSYNLENLFKSYDEGKSIPESYLHLGYLYSYFSNEFCNLTSTDERWYAFASFINSIRPTKPIIQNIPPIEEISNPTIKKILDITNRIPPVIRCAIAFDAICQLTAKERFEMNSIQLESVGESTSFFQKCKIIPALDDSFLPAIYGMNFDVGDLHARGDLRNLNSWMRNEKNQSTITNRIFLMHLWAGPSDRANEILAFYNSFITDERPIQLANIILPSMFAFWRLYYDKRKSTSYTLTETFEAVFQNATHNGTNLFLGNEFNIIIDYLKLHKDEDKTFYEYNDAWETLTTLSKTKMGNAIYNPVGIMYRLYKVHYNTSKDVFQNISSLKKIIDDAESIIALNYIVIKWSKDIVYLRRFNQKVDVRFMELFTIRRASKNGKNCFFDREIPTIPTLPFPHTQASSTPQNFKLSLSEEEKEKRIVFLHKLIEQSKNSFKFEPNEDYNINPPQCLTDNGLQEFVGGMEFKDINLTPDFKETDTSFTFTANVDTSSDCWKCIKSTISGLKDTENISCTITDTEAEDNLLFHGEISLEGQALTLRNASISLDKLVIESGLDSDWISCSIEASITNKNQVSNDEAFKITIYHPLYSGSINICGQYEGETNKKVVTIPKLINLFGLNDITSSSILPADESIFGTLGLQNLEINLESKPKSEKESESDSDSLKITKLQFVISTEKSWSIFKNEKQNDLISIKPIFEIVINDPTNSDKRKIFCSATGLWTLKNEEKSEETNFYTTLTSDRTIYAGLAEGSTLYLDNIVNLFASEKKNLFPTDIKFTDLSLMADFSSSNYSLSIAAEDVYKFKVGNQDFSIDGLNCSLDFWNGNFGELKLGGQFKLGPIDLNLYGTFSENKTFSFTAEAFNDQEYSIGNFIQDVSTQLKGNEISLPAEIASAYIRNLYVSYNSIGNEFEAKIDIEKVFEIKNFFSIDDLKFKITSTTPTQPQEQPQNELQSGDSTIKFQVCAYISICERAMELSLDYDSEKKKCTFSGSLHKIDITTKDILAIFGIKTDSIPDFILKFKVTDIETTISHQAEDAQAKQGEQNSFNFTFTTNAGTLVISVDSGSETTWSITYTTPKDEKGDDLVNIDVLEIPVAGELVKKIDSTIENTKINNFKIEASNKSGVNLSLGCMAFGQEVNLEVPLSKPKADPQQEPKNFMLLKNDNSPKFVFKGTAVWKKFDKPITILILTVPKIGIGIDNDGHIALLLDASLNVTPLTFSLHNAGAGLSLDSKEIVPYLSGFGVTFNNGVLSIGGSLSLQVDEQGNNEYSGTLLINFKEIGLTAMGSYSQGSMWAYLTLQAPIGGVPAFFIKGLAAGFGYNRRLTLPSIEEVNDYPLIKAAKDPSSITTDDLNEIIKQEKGQYFFAAGIKFTSFKIIDGFLLATVSFGNDCEVGLLGLAEITVPPNMNGKKCLAKAQLAIKSSIKPDDGIFSAEAQLTNESFILTKECKLTGGFAAYAWFGQNEHSGDFVVTLGGYHPSFVKPPHYPIVPRLGLNWQINKNISIIGEMYFALTPSILMAGGKLCATYEQDDLKAWFIAYADILMNWKPFKYDVSMGVTLGASYTVNLLFVKKTFSVELGADLHLWGPKLHGRIDVSWYIISFSIYFEESGNEQPETLNWDGFIDSFLTAPSNDEEKNIKANKYTLKDEDKDSRSDDILTISLEGVIEKTKEEINNTEIELDIVSPNLLVISAISKIPTEANARPVKDNPTVESTMRVIVEKISENIPETVFDSDKETTDFEDIDQNLPAALWGEGQGNNLNEKDSVLKKICGKNLSIKDKSKLQKEDLFPQGERWILLSELYEDNKINIDDSFKFFKDKDIIPQYFKNSIEELKNNENAEIEDRRNKAINDFLHGQGINISIKKFVDNADDLLSEEIVIIEE